MSGDLPPIGAAFGVPRKWLAKEQAQADLRRHMAEHRVMEADLRKVRRDAKRVRDHDTVAKADKLAAQLKTIEVEYRQAVAEFIAACDQAV